MTIGDFNHDGSLDVATLRNPGGFPCTNPDTIAVLLGKVDGTFRTRPDLVLGTNLGSVAVVAGDFNGDTSLDLAVLNQFNGRVDGSVSILTGLGDGTFQATAEIAVGKRPVALAIADFNDDGLPDLAVLNAPVPDDPMAPPEPGSISILLGQGDGTFQSLPPVEVRPVPSSLAVGDFNDDGIPDLVVANFEGLSLWIGLGSGAFQAPVVVSSAAAQFLVAGDFDRDGHADLAAAIGGTQTSITILLGQGNGTFQTAPTVLVAGTAPAALVLGDVDGDAVPDLVMADRLKNTVSVAHGQGDGTFNVLPAIDVGSAPVALALGDFNRDGRSDLATANHIGGTVSILLGQRRGDFQVAPTYMVNCCPSSVVVGDFDGDGHVDLAEASFPSKSISILRGLGHGRFQATAPLPVPDFPWEMAVADFDGDGHLDLAITNPGLSGGGNTVSILLGRGDGSFQVAPTVTVGSAPVAIVSADFDGDGRPDLAVTNDAGGSVSILLGRGDGTFQAAPTVPVGRNPLAMAAADINNDGCVDLVVANTNQSGLQPGSISVLLGGCDGTFQAAPEATVGVRPISVAVGDLNGDGRLDLAVVNQFGNPLMSILLGNGDGTFQAAPEVAVGGERVVIADFNGDGRQDLAVANINNYVTIVLGRGDGTFKVGPSAGVGSAPEFMVLQDFDGDGLPDLVTADYESPSLSILVNRSKKHRWFGDDVRTSQVREPRHELRPPERFPVWLRMGF